MKLSPTMEQCIISAAKSRNNEIHFVRGGFTANTMKALKTRKLIQRKGTGREIDGFPYEICMLTNDGWKVARELMNVRQEYGTYDR